MPSPGVVNNPAGENAYSEPGYGEIAKEKVLTRAAPVGSPSPDSVPKRAQRRAVRGGQGGSGAPPGPLAQPHAPTVDAAAQQTEFWQTVLTDPAASPLAREYAQRALGA